MRNTISTDFQKYYDITLKVIEDCKNITTAYKVFYGKADYGYFVQVYCSDYDQNRKTDFNTDTKAGAKHLAKIIANDLNLPLESDWD
jgi:hypothetical protein